MSAPHPDNDRVIIVGEDPYGDLRVQRLKVASQTGLSYKVRWRAVDLDDNVKYGGETGLRRSRVMAYVQGWHDGALNNEEG